MDSAIELNDATFDNEVKNSDKLMLVDFFATWCGPCKKQLPIIEDLASDFLGKIKVGKLNVDNQPKKATEFGISSIPALLLFKDGKMVERMTGLQTKSQLTNVIEKYL